MLDQEVERSRANFRLANLDPSWLQRLRDVDVVDPPGDWRESVALLGLEHDDEDLVVMTFPDGDLDADRRWVLDRVRSAIAKGMPGEGPAVPLLRRDELGVLGTLFPLHVLASAIPEVNRFHVEHGVPPDVTAATLDVRSVLSRTDADLPVVDTSGWFLWRYRGLLYQVQALRVIPVRLGEAPDSEAFYRGADEHPRAPGHRRGDPALSIHIPARTTLGPDEVRSALDAMASAFATWFSPDGPPRIGTCGSWLLDPQLREYLDESSNIIRFQDLFTLFDDGRQTDSIMQFVFPDNPDTPLDELPTESSLQRAIVSHLRRGGHWRSCNGWVPLG